MGKTADSSPKQHKAPNVEEVRSCPNQEKVDPRVRRTRKLLYDAFRELIHERAFSDISVADITERATLNRATFYAHFEDKGHLASSMVREELEAMLLERLAPPAEFGPESVGRVAAGTLDFVGNCLGRCPKNAEQFAASLGMTVQEALERFFLRWFTYEPDAPRRFGRTTPETLANALAWSLYGAAIRWSRLHDRPDAETAARETVEVFFR